MEENCHIRRWEHWENHTVISGDGNIGKTTLALHHIRGEFINTYVGTCLDVLDREVYDVKKDDNKVRQIKVDFYDVEHAGEDWDRLRPLYYVQTSTVILCFSIGCPDSYERIEEFWKGFLEEYCPEASIVLADVMKELSKTKQTPVTYQQGEELAIKIKAVAYLECSSFKSEGVEEVFTKAAQV